MSDPATTSSGYKPFTEVAPSRTASRATIYIPPDATGTYTGGYAAATSKSAHVPNPSTPAFINDFQWINSYLIIHKMTTPSYRYSFLLWILVVFVVLVIGILHWTGSRGGFFGAAWSKWALRRRTWRKKHALAQAKRDGKPHSQPFSFPSNAQMLSLVFLFIIPLALCVVGPDYIAPYTKLWDLTHNMTRRGEPSDKVMQLDLQSRAAIASTATTRSPEYTIQKAWWTAGGRTGIIAFSLFPLVTLFSLKAPPLAVFAIPYLVQIHFDKLARLHRWTGRLIWFITSVHVFTWGVQLGRDKRGTGNQKYPDAPAWMFVWQYPLFIEGVIAYVALTALVVLSLDSFRVRYYEAFYVLHIILVPVTLIFSALHFPTIWWWCWSALFLWIGERTHRAIRWAFVNGLMGKDKIPKGVIPPPVKIGPTHRTLKKAPPSAAERMQDWENGVRLVRRDGAGNEDPNTLPLQPGQQSALRRDPSYQSTYDNSILDAYQDIDPNDSYNQSTYKRMSSYASSMRDDMEKRGSNGTAGSQSELMQQYPPDPHSPNSPQTTRPLNVTFQQDHHSPTYPPTLASHSRYSTIPPPGFAHAQLLPGRVVRLRLLTPRPITWAPGQHVLLQVPVVSKYQTHPFTISGCYDAESETGEGRVVELLIRAKNGFTKDLWDHIVQLLQGSTPVQPGEYPFAEGGYDVENGNNSLREKQSLRKPIEPSGVLIRAYVDGPFGSSIRAHWGNHSTVLIIVGGTGVSFGVSILEYLSMCLAGRDGKTLGGRPGGWGHQGFKTTRVRFVWLVREFSHIQWCATILRRCMELVPSSALQVDIFVTNPTEVKNNRNSVLTLTDVGPGGRDEFAPPSAQFMRRPRSGSASSIESGNSAGYSAANSTVDLSYLQQNSGEGSAHGGDYYLAGELGHEGHILDYTNFDGEVDTRAPGEAKISKKLQKEGKIRRARSRKVTMAQGAKAGLEARSKHGTHGSGPAVHPIIEIPGERDPFRANASPPRETALPQGAYSPMAKRMSQQWSPPTSFDPKFAVSAADQYRQNGNETFLSPVDGQKRWSATSGVYRTASPAFKSTDEFRHSVASIGDLARGATPSPGPGNESIHRLMHERPESRQSETGDEPRLEISDQELEDISFVSEMARPGKPKIERILADEVGRSRGAVAVACCGPASLNALVRKIVAQQINPRQVMRGEMQGMLTLITEEFQW